MNDQPTIHSVRKTSGIAGQIGISAQVQYPDEDKRTVTFVGSVYGGPVVMESDGREVFVSNPERFGKFSEAWVRAFFAAA